MSYEGICTNRVAFHGPDKVPANVRFPNGLNVVYGASDKGESYVVETIDFMFGGKGPLTDFEESMGYDRVFMSFSCGEQVKTDRITLNTVIG